MALMKTLEEKRAYFNRVKRPNSQASLRLEGLGDVPSSVTAMPSTKEGRNKLRTQLIKRYLAGSNG